MSVNLQLKDKVYVEKWDTFGTVEKIIDEETVELKFENMINQSYSIKDLIKVEKRNLGSIDKWQKKWEKVFQSVRLRWLTELNPKAMEFFGHLEILYAERDRLYFKALNRVHAVEIERGGIVLTRASTNYIVLEGKNYWNNQEQVIKYPFKTEKEMEVVLSFLEEKKEMIQQAMEEIKVEMYSDRKKSFKEKYIGIQIEDYDEKRNEFILSNGERVAAYSFSDSFDEKYRKSILGE